MPSSWSDIPPELLGLVLSHIHSLADRARFRAICRLCHYAAEQYPPPPTLPWLVIDPSGTSFTLSSGGGIMDGFPNLPGNNILCYGTVDNFLFIMNLESSEFFLFNPFSKAMVLLRELAISCYQNLLWQNQRDVLTYKVVICSSTGLVPGCILAIKNPCLVMVFRLGTGSSATRVLPQLLSYIIDDIAFYQGKLYSLTISGELYAMEVIVDGSELEVACKKCIYSNCFTSNYAKGLFSMGNYLVESRGKLLMVNRYANIALSPEEGPRTFSFEVFKAEFSTSPCRWTRMESLDGEMLFVSKSCSKSLPASRYDGVKGDCIYFTRDSSWTGDSPHFNSWVFNMGDGTIEPFSPTTEHQHEKWCQAWLFPPE